MKIVGQAPAILRRRKPYLSFVAQIWAMTAKKSDSPVAAAAVAAQQICCNAAASGRVLRKNG